MVIQELVAKLGFQVDQGGVNTIDGELDKLLSKAAQFVSIAYLAKKAFDGVVAGISESISAASQKEDVTTQFKVMLGDLEAAKYLYQEINQYAAESPFETAPLAENIKLMMSFGMSAKDAFSDMKMLGDVSLGNQEKMNRLSLAYAQTQSAKRLTGQDLLQYINAGFNPLEYIAKKTGKSQEALREEMGKGKISVDMVRDAFVEATSVGGKFYKGAEEGSKTWNGMMSTLRDNARMLAATMGEMILPFMKSILEKFQELWPVIEGSFRAMGEFFGILFENGPDATDWAVGFAVTLSTIPDLVMTIVSAFMFLWTIVQGIGTVLGMVVATFVDGIMFLPKLLAQVARGVNFVMRQIGRATGNREMQREAIRGQGEAEAFIGEGMWSQTAAQWDIGKQQTSDAWDKFRELSSKIGTTSAGEGPMKETQRIRDILDNKGAKQPVTINNIHNEVTVHGAEDPLRIASESIFGQAFQRQFLLVQSATV